VFGTKAQSAPEEKGHVQFPFPGKVIAICLGLFGLVTWAFLPALQNGFLNYDDQDYVTANDPVHHGLTWAGVKWAFQSTEAANWHPVTWLSHMLDCQWYGFNPWGHHLTSVLLHAINSMLVFLVLRRMTGAVWRSALVAALFGLHPMHVESVAWVAERKDVLSACFAMLTLWAYSRYAEFKIQNSQFKIREWIWFAAALILFALGLMSKPMLVTLPVILLLLDFWPLARFGPAESGGPTGQGAGSGKVACLGRLLLEKWPFFALAFASSVITVVAQHGVGAVETLEQVSLTSRVANALAAYVAYIQKCFYAGKLAVFYPYQEIPAGEALWAGLLLLGVTVVSIRLARSRPYLVVGWFWFLVVLLPVIGLVQVGSQAMADRYSYLPFVGLFLILAWGVFEATPASSLWRLGVSLGCASLLLALFAGTRSQIRFWRDSVTLFAHAVEVTAPNAMALNNLGMGLFETGKADRAAECFQAALDLAPAFAHAHYNLGTTLAFRGRYAEAETRFRAALKSRPGYTDALVSLGSVLAMEGKNEEAEAVLRESVRQRPRDLKLRLNFGNVLAARGKTAEGLAEYYAATRLDPQDAVLRVTLGSWLVDLGQTDEGLVQLQEALRLQPTAAAHEMVAAVLARRGDWSGAMQQNREALRLQPESLTALINLAWILATSPDEKVRDGAAAVRGAERACELSAYTNTLAVTTLAAAYAEAGRFAEAAGTARKACALASASGAAALLQKNQELLERFKAGLPYHEEAKPAGPARHPDPGGAPAATGPP
jgi:protein O-mannosyl-transferase